MVLLVYKLFVPRRKIKNDIDSSTAIFRKKLPNSVTNLQGAPTKREEVSRKAPNMAII